MLSYLACAANEWTLKDYRSIQRCMSILLTWMRAPTLSVEKMVAQNLHAGAENVAARICTLALTFDTNHTAHAASAGVSLVL